ncbi:MAG: HEPN domain-containing protein [Candidatus Solibacter sp.]|nr:HEPN domain-containing protein [Candidatus Solibacter sp.]
MADSGESGRLRHPYRVGDRSKWIAGTKRVYRSLSARVKALLSDAGVRFRKTHEIGALMALLAQAGHALPDKFEDLGVLTPVGAIYRYEDYDAVVSLDRPAARESLSDLRALVETRLRNAPVSSRSLAVS